MDATPKINVKTRNITATPFLFSDFLTISSLIIRPIEKKPNPSCNIGIPTNINTPAAINPIKPTARIADTNISNGINIATL